VVFDVVYDPWPTALAEAPNARLHDRERARHAARQGVLQFQLFTGCRRRPRRCVPLWWRAASPMIVT